RGFHVTGVQTCALPIWAGHPRGPLHLPPVRAAYGRRPRRVVGGGDGTADPAGRDRRPPRHGGTGPGRRVDPRLGPGGLGGPGREPRVRAGARGGDGAGRGGPAHRALRQRVHAGPRQLRPGRERRAAAARRRGRRRTRVRQPSAVRATPAHVMSVRTAERPGTAGPTEDRIFGTSDAVVVLDGATQPEPGGRTGGWLAEALGREIQRRLESSRGDLAALLAAAISTVADRYALRPGSDPSTTVSIVRWDDCYVDVLVLGDSPVVALTTAGGIRQVRDDRLQAVAAEQRRQLRERPGVDRWRQLHQAMLLQRNKPGGYWIAEATPEAAWHARRARWRRGDLVAVLAMTDGVSV